jgi:hypothetical protein
MANAPFDILLDKTSILELVPNGTVVGTLSTIDPDEGDSFTYELLNDADGRFKLSDSGNQIVVKDNSKFDYKTAFFHTIRVKVTDSSDLNLTFEKNIDIGLIDAKRNLVGYWKLDETSGTTVINSSLVKAGMDGVYGFKSYNSTEIKFNFLTLGLEGLWNKSVGFGSGIVSLPSNTDLFGSPSDSDSPPLTVTAWVKPSKFEGRQTIFTASTAGEYSGYWFGLEGKKLIYYSAYTTRSVAFDLPANIFANQWFHVALSYDNGASVLYVNGVAIGSDSSNIFKQGNLNNYIGSELGYRAGILNTVIDCEF